MKKKMTCGITEMLTGENMDSNGGRRGQWDGSGWVLKCLGRLDDSFEMPPGISDKF